MPLVNFKLTPDGLTTEKKKVLIEEVTQLLHRELGKNPETTIVVIEEVHSDNWGVGGISVTERRKSSA
ncbi:MAG: 4-oxalocrotonate tautomerase family protein [Pseudomonadota bacterium]